jgi:23S rRNA (uracil1939-C5)-methyltransferase
MSDRDGAGVGDLVEIEIRALASGGAGVGDLPDGRVVFVQRTAPGDMAQIRIDKSRPRWAAGSLDRLLAPGPDRAEPACPLYARCGGCHLQHIRYEQQLEWKGRFITDALARIGGFDGLGPVTVEPSPRTERYRNRVTFTLRRLRGGRVVAGFHALGRPAHVIDVGRECLLPEDEVMAVWESIRGAWGPGARNLPAAGRLRLTLRLGADGVELLVQGGERRWNAGPLLERVPTISAVWHLPGDAKGSATLVAGTPGLGGGTAFEQVNRSAAAALRTYVVDSIGKPDSGATRLIDAYCGTGDYGRALAAEGWSVLGIEIDPMAVTVALTDAPEGFDVDRGSVEVLVASALPADVLLVNPPRGGLHADVPPLILEDAPERVVYVSCDAATLARDLAALRERYEVVSVRAFDLFPQTAHVETVTVLRRRPFADVGASVVAP